MDLITSWAVRGIVGLSCFACSVVFYSMSNDISIIQTDVGTMKGDVIRLKQQMEDHIESSKNRDAAIKDIQNRINK